jgi:hypothetical protein
MSYPSPDEEHLNLLAIFHYIVGGLMALFACFALIYVLLGVALVASPSMLSDGHSANAPPAAVGIFLAAFGIVFFLIGATLGTCTIVSGRHLSKHQKYNFSFVMACIECIWIPFGTILGVFTLIVLSRPSVKALFGVPGRPLPPPSPPLE